MATLNKTLMAAVACGVIAFAGSVFAQDGPAGTTSGAAAEAVNPSGSTGANSGNNSAQSSETGLPDNMANTLANNGVNPRGSETNNDLGAYTELGGK